MDDRLKTRAMKIQTMLDFAALPLDSKQREVLYSRSCERWSESDCLATLQTLVDEGYIDYVYSLKSAFHTNKGRAAYLASLRPAESRDTGRDHVRGDAGRFR